MNHSFLSVKTMPQLLPMTAGRALSVAALIITVSMSCTAHAQPPSSGDSITSEQSMSMQIRYAENSRERQHPAENREAAKSGAVKKDPQRLDTRQEMDREEKAGGNSSTGRDPGSQRKVRRALA